jgi:hypothetical protein
MSVLKRVVSVVGVMTLIVLSVAVLAPKTSHAVAAAFVQIVPGSTTHVGQNEGQIVNLVCFGTRNCERESSTANVDSNDYVVPAGYTLIITDISWAAEDIAPGHYGCEVLQTQFSSFNLTNDCVLGDAGGVAEHIFHLNNWGAGRLWPDFERILG